MVAAPNVFRVQDGPAAATPLILFHDGGGTVFSYYFIDNVHRTVYGVANPRLESGRPWKGGVQEMAKEYCALVRQCVPSGEVILGGWSLGGIVALEIAHLLRDQSRINVIGLLFVDVAFPQPSEDDLKDFKIVDYDLPFPAGTKPAVKTMITRAMAETMQIAKTWPLPQWNADRSPPPTVLLRAMEIVPTGSTDADVITCFDGFRKDETLGWKKKYEYDFIEKVIEIPGNHHNVFEKTHLPALTKAIDDGCKFLERDL